MSGGVLQKSVFVEIVRLLIVLGCTAGGYGLGLRLEIALLGTIFGAGVGYVFGGVLGRSLKSTMGEVEAQTAHLSAGEFLTGAVGALLLGGLGALVGIAAIGLLPGGWGWLVFGIIVWMGVHSGFQIALRRSADVLALVGLRDGALLNAGATDTQDAVLVDTNVLVDGRLLRVARTGFLHRNLLVPTFVLEELQELADSKDPKLRKKGRLGLETLDAIRRDALLHVQVPEEQIPELETVDAKLIALATRLSVSLLTNDEPLSRVAELRGVRCLSMTRLAKSLSSVRSTGEIVHVAIVKKGQHEGEGVGFMEEGSMIVVADAADKVGLEADVQITASVNTPRGRIFFASLVEA